MINKRRVYFFIFLLLLTAIMLSTSTYAWFTHNRIVTIRSINIHVEASGGIEISSNAINWTTVVDPEDIISARDQGYLGSTNQIPDRMEPVSTGKEIDATTGFLKMYYGTAESDEDGNNILTSTRNIETESHGSTSIGKFIAFDLFFRTFNDIDIYMSTNSNVVYMDTNSEKGIAASTRVAYLIQGTRPIGTNPAVVQALKGATPATTYIWEPNYDVHTDAAVAHAQSVYGITIPNTNGPQIPYDGLISAFTKDIGVNVKDANQTKYPNYFKRVNIDYYTEKNFDQFKQIFRLQQGITKVRIYMWIEGQDVDCEDGASFDDIVFNLQFTINPA